MFSFDASFRPKEISKSLNNRIRVVGIFSPDQLLYTIISSKKTEILLVSSNGLSFTLISFEKYIDIVSADLSADCRILALTERFFKGEKFHFRTIYHDVHTNVQSAYFEYEVPIYSFFIQDPSDDIYQTIQIIGNKIVHYKLRITSNSLQVFTFKGGVDVKDCSRYYFNKFDRFLGVFHSNDDKMSIFFFNVKNGFTELQTFHIKFGCAAMLPDELALLPSVPSQLPYYKFSRGNAYVIVLRNLIGIVEQNYFPCAPLTFSVSNTAGFHHQYAIPDVQNDLPIVYLHFDSLVFIMVQNKALALIDFAVSPIFVSILPVSLQTTTPAFGSLASAIGSSNHVIDLESGTVFQCSIQLKSIPKSLNFHNTQLLQAFAILCARLSQVFPLSLLLNTITQASLKVPEIDSPESKNLQPHMKSIFSGQLFFENNFAYNSSGRKIILNQCQEDQKVSELIVKKRQSKLLSKIKINKSKSLSEEPPQIEILSKNSIISSKNEHNQNLITLSSEDRCFQLYVTFFSAYFQAGLIYHGKRHRQRSNSTGKEKSKSIFSKKVSNHFYPTPESIDLIRRMEEDFPSAGPISRMEYFYQIFNQIMSNHNSHSYSRKASDEAFLQLELQNQLITVLRYGLNEWIATYNPDEITIFQVYLIVMSECVFLSGPRVPSLPNQLFELSEKLCPKSIQKILQDHQLIPNVAEDNKSKSMSEYDYWSKRIPFVSLNKFQTGHRFDFVHEGSEGCQVRSSNSISFAEDD